jgi:primase-polymerase (primpol)-like protein
MNALLTQTPETAETTPALQQLQGHSQWVVWQRELVNGRNAKVPYDPETGQRASVTDPATWGDYETACKSCQAELMDGLGFVLTPATGLVVVDLDGCRDEDTGEVEPGAQGIVDRLNSYTEVSPSGTGLHVWVRGKLPGMRNRQGGIEFYGQDRYITLSRVHYPGSPCTIEPRQAELDAVYRELFGEETTPPKSPKRVPGYPGARACVVDTVGGDEDVLAKARAAGSGPLFCELLAGQWQNNPRYPSQSEADLAFCGMLAYWTDGNGAQMDRLFRQSGLMRPKWDEPRRQSTYGQDTIQKALEGRKSW